MAFTSLFVPSVFDRADGGLTSNYGTSWGVSVPGMNGIGKNSSVIGLNYKGGTIDFSKYDAQSIFGHLHIFEEASDSPTFDIGEQATIIHRFFVDYYTMQNLIIEYKRGYEMYDNSSGPLGPNISRVLSTTAQPIAKTAGLIWTLNMTTECMSFPGPPDEFSVQNVELNPAAEKHPRYSALTYFQRDQIRNQTVADYIDVKQQYSDLINTFSGSKNQWQDQKGQALELLYKKQKGEDSFYMSGYKIEYSKYFWYPQDINPGGYIEDPFAVIPYQFITDEDGFNIFSLTADYNANLYPNPALTPPIEPPFGLSWLRQTDIQVLNRTWYKVTMTWIGASLGQWDKQWYSTDLQPLQTSASLGNLNLAS